jgi:hypothetical protein
LGGDTKQNMSKHVPHAFTGPFYYCTTCTQVKSHPLHYIIDDIYEPAMNPNPQAVTNRYLNNLLRDGQNNDYAIVQLHAHDNVIGGDVCGTYFKVQIRQRFTISEQTANGVTPEHALRNALEKYGVTFR